MTTVRVLAPYFTPAVNGGGPIRTLDALTRTAPEGLDIEVLTSDRDLGCAERLPVPHGTVRDGRRRIRYLDVRGIAGIGRLARAVRRPVYDVLYLNSVFDARFAVLPLALRRGGLMPTCTFLVAPRGEFDPGALTVKSTKKRVFLAAARWAGVFRGLVWHASTQLEAEHIRRVVGPDAVVVVRENETDLPVRALREPVPEPEPLRVVTIGRISPKKRLHLLIEALGSVDAPVHLTVIGPDDDAHYARRCRTIAAGLPPSATVVFRGALPHDEVMRQLAACHAMVTATAGENFGHTIAEALSAGRPVLLPDTTPWSGRVRAGAGEVVADDEWPTVLTRWARAPRAVLTERASRAADAYDRWRDEGRAPHVFELLLGG